MRGDGPVEALGGEDGVGVGRFGGLGLGVGFCGRGLQGDVSGIECVSCVGGGVRVEKGFEVRSGRFRWMDFLVRTGLEVARCLL